ncbi:MAG: malonate transporter subunit MadM [Clostridiales bacterium]|nr:MAG: malonate transporter subunit MadM [Clostridiales bacterium]
MAGIVAVFVKYNLVMAFIIIGAVMYVSGHISRLLGKKIAGSAIAIIIGLILAFVGGTITGEGAGGISKIPLFSGLGIMGGSMLRDYCIISTAFGAKISEIKKAGLAGIISLFMGVISAFIVGVVIAIMFGYNDVVSATTIGAGAVTFIVGPVTGAALGASSDVIALSIAAGVVKSILVMIITPLIAKQIGLNNSKSAMIYGGLMGTTSGVAAGLAATDARLIPYGAMTATFYTGTGCLLCPSVLFLITKAIIG